MKQRRKIALRSSKGKRIISISIRDDISEKELMKVLLTVFEAEAEGNTPTPEVLWIEEMKALWKQREDAKSMIGGEMKTLADIEERWYKQHLGTYTPADIDREEWLEDMTNIPLLAYLKKIWELPDQQRNVMVARMRRELEAYRKAELTIRYGGDPEEVVWRGLTRAHLMDVFKKEKGRVYTVGDVASMLSISYNQAYNHIVPFLKKQGVKVK
jgi:hypothetical protein